MITGDIRHAGRVLEQQAGGQRGRAGEKHIRQDGREQRRAADAGRVPQGLPAGRGAVQDAGALIGPRQHATQPEAQAPRGAARTPQRRASSSRSRASSSPRNSPSRGVSRAMRKASAVRQTALVEKKGGKERVDRFLDQSSWTVRLVKRTHFQF